MLVVQNCTMSPLSPSIQMASTVESEFHASSRTLYPHFRPSWEIKSFPFTESCSAFRENSPCRSPFRSKKITSCLPSLPAPPPSKPKRWVLTITFPEGRQTSGCSKPGTSSEVDCSTPWRSYTRSVRCESESEIPGDNDETTKDAPSPRQLIRGSRSSSGLTPALTLCGSWAAAFPREPWNWVCLEPQPTLIGASSCLHHWKTKEWSQWVNIPCPKSSVYSGDSTRTSNKDDKRINLWSPKEKMSQSLDRIKSRQSYPWRWLQLTRQGSKRPREFQIQKCPQLRTES